MQEMQQSQSVGQPSMAPAPAAGADIWGTPFGGGGAFGGGAEWGGGAFGNQMGGPPMAPMLFLGSDGMDGNGNGGGPLMGAAGGLGQPAGMNDGFAGYGGDGGGGGYGGGMPVNGGGMPVNGGDSLGGVGTLGGATGRDSLPLDAPVGIRAERGREQLLDFLQQRAVSDADQLVGMLGVQNLDDLQVLMPEDLPKSLTPVQRRRLLMAINEAKQSTQRVDAPLSPGGQQLSSGGATSQPQSPLRMPLQPAPSSAPQPAGGGVSPVRGPVAAPVGRVMDAANFPALGGPGGGAGKDFPALGGGGGGLGIHAMVEQQQEPPQPVEPPRPNRGWEKGEIIQARAEAKAREEAQAQAATSGGAGSGGLNWQQEHQKRESEEAGGGDGGGTMPAANMLCGDWICSCGEHNFAKRQRCWKCRGRKTNNVITAAPREKKNAKPGDWTCGKCEADNFARRTACYRCSAKKPEGAIITGVNSGAQSEAQGKGGGAGAQGGAGGVAGGEGEARKLRDWPCAKCGVRNFKRNTRCFQCQALRESDQPPARSSGGGNESGEVEHGSKGGGGGGSGGPSGGGGFGASENEEHAAVETLTAMLRKSGGEQVVSVLVQYFAEANPQLKNAVLPRGAVGGPRKWFLKHAAVFQLSQPDAFGQSIVRLRASTPVAAAAPPSGGGGSG
eukprot:SAG11_NODE_749_length_7363_cov_12.270099_5_plen_669_part_01